LIVHRTGDRAVDVGASRYAADRILGARLVELPDGDNLPFVGDTEAVAAEIEEFLTGSWTPPLPDRVLATILFTDDGPARAVTCAAAIGRELRTLGLEVRAAVHTGEVELRNGDIGGIAVHIAARVMGLARPNEVLVSSTVRDPVAGAEIRFEDRSVQSLRGVPGQWHLFAAFT
jgi:class 3 adenylate cyclase